MSIEKNELIGVSTGLSDYLGTEGRMKHFCDKENTAQKPISPQALLSGIKTV